MPVTICAERIRFVGEFLRGTPDAKPFNFYSYALPDGKEIVDSQTFPPLEHPAAVDFFFAVIMHDYGFWRGNDDPPYLASRASYERLAAREALGYVEPIYACIDGKLRKGSDFLWAASRRILEHDPSFFFSILNLGTLTEHEMRLLWMADDKDSMPFPDIDTRLALTRAYGKKLHTMRKRPAGIVEEANASAHPLKTFLQILRDIPGYYEDPLQKKAMLLAMALANRPEHFLHAEPRDPAWHGIIDYHLMRVMMRLGLIDPGNWRPYVTERCVKPQSPGEIKVPYIPERGEHEIRQAALEVVSELMRTSGKPMCDIDFLLWSARKYCPEMDVPACGKCPLNAACEKHIELFQPVRRTTFY